MVRKNYPIVFGAWDEPNKIAVGIKANIGVGYDVIILGLKDDHHYVDGCSKEELKDSLNGQEYATLRFCTMESLDIFIKLLQDTKKLWKKERANDRT